MSGRTEVQLPIAGVTVFRDGARIVRRGPATLPAGTSVVAVGHLPRTLEPDSVRVTVRGSEVALLDVGVESGFRSDPLLEGVAELEALVEEHRDEVQEIADEDAAVEARLGYLAHLSESAARSLASAVGFGRRDVEELLRMADTLAGGTAAALAARRQLSGRRREAQRRLDAATRRLEAVERRPERAVEMFDVVATVEAGGETAGELEVSYHVRDASWRALYDLRLEGERMAVHYLAEVTQHSGEDWPAVDLTLSTTRRGHHTQLPELEPWYIGRLDPQPRFVAHAVRARSAAPPDGEAFAAPQGAPVGAGAAPAPAPMAASMPLTAEVVETGTALVYKVPRPLEIPSDRHPHKVTVDRFELDAALDHLAVPTLAAEAYLRATVTNTSQLLLLPGPANVFHDAEFVGRTAVDTVAPGEELEIQLGVDERVRVERELRRRDASKAILGSTRTIDLAYEIKVENHAGRTSKVSVHDHIPLSRDAEVKVRLREATPKPAEQDELGELTWTLELEPGADATIRLSFTVEHPAGTAVYGL